MAIERTTDDPFGWAGSCLDNRFRIDAVAGEGAFGVVYRAHHLGFDEPVAVKCLKIPARLREQERAQFLASFHAEARLSLRLSARTNGIVRALDVGAATSPTGDWTPYLVMEWLEGKTLADELVDRAGSGRLGRPLAEAIELLSPVAEALGVAHAEGVAHRDIKPGNVFLAGGARGGAPTVKVLDFGVAKIVSDPSLTSALQRTGATLRAFTPQYGAPEQFSTRYGATGPWTDVFALALLLIEVASGKPALDGRDNMQLFVAACDEARRPSLAARGVIASASIERVLRHALEVDPAQRIASADVLWRTLETARSSLADTAIDPSTDGRSVAVPLPPRAPTVALPLTTPPVTQDGATPEENRLCTIVFADLSGFTELSERLDPEEVKELIDRCFGALTTCIERLGGWVDKFIGDCVMAIFGAPRSTDNDAERAVIAALEMQAALSSLSASERSLRGKGLGMRVGINTGRVFAGRVGGSTRRDFTVIGDAVNVAARLQEHAPPGAVVIGRDTLRHVEGLFQVEPLPPIDAKGKSEPLSAFRVLGRRADRPLIPPSDFHGLETRLVGRAAEMQRLLDEIEGALSEREPRLMTLVGPPGVGRSRLLAEIAREWDKRAAPSHLMAAQASPLTTRASYRLCASLLASRFHLHDDDPVDVIRRKLGRRLRGAEPSLFPTRSPSPDATPESAPPISLQADDELVRIAAELTPLLGAGPASTQTPDSLAPDEGWSQAKNRIAAAVARLLGAAAAHAPVILLCDDIHWADDASLDLLDELVLRLGEAPVAVVCAARPELYDRRPHWGEGRASYRRIDVGPLARRHVEEMARDRLRNVPDLAPDVVRLLAERAEGNALTLEESLHLLVEAGVVDRTDPSRWRVHGDRLQALALPPTMHGIVQARLDRLDPDERTALAAASVIGRTFWEAAVEHLRADPASVGGSLPSPRSSAAETLARLRARQWIRARELSSLPGEREFVFAESATQEVAYDTLSQRVRRRLHHRLTGWLAERLPPDAGAAQLALHHDRAGDRGAAATAYARAALRAAALGQNADALRQLERAREIHDQSTDPSATKRQTGNTGANASSSADQSDRRVATWQDRTRLRLDLGDVLRRVGQLDEAERHYHEARALLPRTERRRGGCVDLASVQQWQARIDFRMALAQRVRGATEPALELALRAIAIAEQAGAVDETPAMWAVVAALHRRARDLDAFRAAAISGLRVCRAAKVRDERWRESVSRLLTTLGGVFLFRRQAVRAERCFRQAARVVDERTQPEAASYALNDLAVLRAVNGDMEGAREMFARALALREQMGDLRSVAVTLSNLAEAELQLGHVQAALEHARRATGLAEQVHAEADLPEVRRILAGALAASGDRAAAIDWGLRAVEAAEVPSARVYLADAATALARICRDVARGASDASDQPLRERAREVARALSARLELEADVHPRKLEECRALLADAAQAHLGPDRGRERDL